MKTAVAAPDAKNTRMPGSSEHLPFPEGQCADIYLNELAFSQRLAMMCSTNKSSGMSAVEIRQFTTGHSPAKQ